MKVLVTGAAGYVGRHVVLYLIEAGHTVVATDLLPLVSWEYPKRLRNHKKIEFMAGMDLRSKQQVELLFRGRRKDFDTVVHLAALTSVPEGELKPAEYYATNAGVTAGLILEASKNGKPHFILASSAAVFTETCQPVDDFTEKRPKNNYGLSKVAAERLVSTVYDSSWTILQFFNIAGVDQEVGRTKPGGLFSRIAESMAEKKKFVVHGTGYQVRDYVHIADVGRVVLANLSPPRCEFIRVGTGRGHTVSDVIRVFETVAGKPLSLKLDPKNDGGVVYSVCVPSNAFSCLGTLRMMADEELKWAMNQIPQHRNFLTTKPSSKMRKSSPNTSSRASNG